MNIYIYVSSFRVMKNAHSSRNYTHGSTIPSSLTPSSLAIAFKINKIRLIISKLSLSYFIYIWKIKERTREREFSFAKQEEKEEKER